MKFKRPRRSDLILLLIIAILIIPQTRKPIQVAFHKILAKIDPKIEATEEREQLEFKSWKIRNLEGVQLDFRNLKGNVIILNFWATWCPPCIAEMPSLEALYADYKDKVEFVLVSAEDETIIKNFLDSKGYSLSSYVYESSFPENKQVRSIPRTFVIDQEGFIVIDKNGAADWNSRTVRKTLDDLLK